MMPGSPLIWLAMFGWLAAGGTYVFKEIQRGKDYRAAYADGERTGMASAARATVSSATETITIIREAEEATPLIVESQALKALCCARSSCRNRAKLIAEGQCR